MANKNKNVPPQIGMSKIKIQLVKNRSAFINYPLPNNLIAIILLCTGENFLREIKLTKGMSAFVSEEDYAWLMQWKWCVSYHGKPGKTDKWYAVRGRSKAERQASGKSSLVRMHVEIYKRKHGEIPMGYVVDHLDNNGLNNMRDNFQLITHLENVQRQNGWRRSKQTYRTAIDMIDF